MQGRVEQIINDRSKAGEKSLPISFILFWVVVYWGRYSIVLAVIFGFVFLLMPSFLQIIINIRNSPTPKKYYRHYNRFIYLKLLGGNKTLNNIDIGLNTSTVPFNYMAGHTDLLQYSLAAIPIDILDNLSDSRLDKSRAEGLIIEKYFQMLEMDYKKA